MSDYLPARYTLPAILKGDTFPGIPELAVTINGAAPTNALSSVRMFFRATETAAATSLELTSADGDITINDAATWNITVEPFTVTLDAGIHSYDIEFIDAAGNINTYVRGRWEIEQDITY